MLGREDRRSVDDDKTDQSTREIRFAKSTAAQRDEAVGRLVVI